jgi:hypothetical protein
MTSMKPLQQRMSPTLQIGNTILGGAKRFEIDAQASLVVVVVR